MVQSGSSIKRMRYREMRYRADAVQNRCGEEQMCYRADMAQSGYSAERMQCREMCYRADAV